MMDHKHGTDGQSPNSMFEFLLGKHVLWALTYSSTGDVMGASDVISVII